MLLLILVSGNSKLIELDDFFTEKPNFKPYQFVFPDKRIFDADKTMEDKVLDEDKQMADNVLDEDTQM